MYVEINLMADKGEARLSEPEDFTRFGVMLRCSGDDAGVAEVLRGIGDVDADGAHVWIKLDRIRYLAGDLAGQTKWATDFGQMIAFANSHGWLSPQRDAIRAHVERK